NCTIQELKPSHTLSYRLGTQNFNCTIQELKRKHQVVCTYSHLFQLHHTGIKTSFR
ncbi:hypothetical protein HMPREF1988_02032, partial [Porphyromonas gingivalis F0185]